MNLDIQKSVSLSAHTTLKVGGKADYFCLVNNENELEEATQYAAENNLPVIVLGGGSNVLVSDEGIDGLVIKNKITGWSKKIEDEHVYLTVGAGETLDDVVIKTIEKGWWGLENLSHIPGTVGALPIQNVGAYGVEAKDLIESVRVYNWAEKSFQNFSASDCHFAYRDSIFKQEDSKHLIVTAVTIKLSTQPLPKLFYRDLLERFPQGQADLQSIRNAVVEIRSQKFPDWQQIGTAGSFFKNPIITRNKYETLKRQYPDLPMHEVNEGEVKIPLGYVLDKILHLKGARIGEVGNYEGQALVLVNYGESAQTVYSYAMMIVEKVFSATEIKIEFEVTKLGKF